ncbi:glycogen/starch/alpha-glucan phosphorylase [Nakamurella sp.]|uniref:glycogen/starch/alpha-glucan phosphorylase n=1 Tax=Nakamurella sp. TaxID=1869182 RepID=UPI003B3B8809
MTKSSRPAIVPSDLDDVERFTEEFLKRLQFGQGVALARATRNDLYYALARTVRQQLMARWLETVQKQMQAKAKVVVYLSAEYLLGRQLDNALLASGLTGTAEQAIGNLGLDLQQIRDTEVEPGLGNGGLGRLAACFIDSLATLRIPAIGYGIRYEYGIFRQTFEDGHQVEQPDSWLTLGSPWEFPHPEMGVKVRFAGHTEKYLGEDGVERTRWNNDWEVIGVPYNYMVPGYRTGNVNTLRLWSARATQAFDLNVFNNGDYLQAIRAQAFAENISKVLYPEDSTPQGKELRLQQQYFFVACSIRDFLNNVLPPGFDLRKLPERVIFQLNDTHPVIAIPELMRILVDEKDIPWDEALDICRQCFAYTCHTLLPEALEVWPVELLGRLLPRHLEIIYRINEEFLAELREAYPDDELRVRSMSIIQEHPSRAVRMAYLATVVGAKVNGVAELHSQLLRDKVLTDFSAYWPDKFTNVTNGITPRRFVGLANPGLTELITDTIGDGWLRDLDRLRELEPYADDPAFLDAFAAVKSGNRARLAGLLERRDGIVLPQDAMYDVMVKRLHEYKRQTLKLLHIVTLYQRLQENPELDIVPRVFVFGAKAAPGYWIAKQTIALINAVGKVIDNDPIVAGRLKVAFPANYNVTLAETLIPAADLSEQISLAGKEASGTGNMKLALNGALTIGTLDGANVEILKAVGEQNFFLFGLTEPEVESIYESGYQPREYFQTNPSLRKALGAIASGAFSDGNRETFAPIVDSLLHEDRFLALADYQSYIEAQDRVDLAYRDQRAWNRSAVLNVARCGFFSSDRSIQDYLDRIWNAAPVVVG